MRGAYSIVILLLFQSFLGALQPIFKADLPFAINPKNNGLLEPLSFGPN